MKKLLMKHRICLLALSIVFGNSILASELPTPATPEAQASVVDTEALASTRMTLTKYIDLPNLGWLAGGALTKSSASEIKEDFIHALINALKLNDVQVTIGTQQEKCDKYIHTKKLKQLMRTISSDLLSTEEKEESHISPEESARNRRMLIASYLEGLKNCLKTVSLQNDLNEGGTHYIQLAKSLETAAAYCRENEKLADIDECIDLAKLPPLLGYELADYCNIANLKFLINQWLQRKPISKAMIIACIKFQPLIHLFNYAGKTAEEIDQAVHGIVAFCIDFVQSDDAMLKLGNCFANYDEEVRPAEANEEAPATVKVLQEALEKATQEAALLKEQAQVPQEDGLTQSREHPEALASITAQLEAAQQAQAQAEARATQWEEMLRAGGQQFIALQDTHRKLEDDYRQLQEARSKSWLSIIKFW